MITLSLLSLGVVILLATITMLTVAVTQSPVLQPSVVNPFGGSCFDPATDTLANALHSEATLNGDWHSVELHNLTEVEALLDTLEAQNANTTELEFVGNDCFTVRWR